MTHADIHALSEINHWRHLLDDIRDMLDQITEQHYTIASQPFDLAGRHHHTEPPLPGGDRLDATGPWASDANAEGCDPTPRQVIVEWTQTLMRHWDQPVPRTLRFAVALRWQHDHTGQILESPYADAWCSELRAVHARLRRLCPPEVDHTHDSTPITEAVTEDDLWEALELHPDHLLTRRDLHHLGIPPSTITTWRSRGKLPEVTPGRYSAHTILEARRTA